MISTLKKERKILAFSMKENIFLKIWYNPFFPGIKIYIYIYVSENVVQFFSKPFPIF